METKKFGDFLLKKPFMCKISQDGVMPFGHRTAYPFGFDICEEISHMYNEILNDI